MRPADAVGPPPQYVFAFGPGWSDGDPERTDRLGGKGASLAAMSRAGFPVPPGFTISAECCEHVERHATWPPGLEDEVRRAIVHLETATDRTFGRGPRPLLLAVRSGAAVSMPGMMDTILNCGLNPSLETVYSSAEAFWPDYAAHIRMFASSVAGLALQFQEGLDPRAQAEAFLAHYAEHVGRPFPVDPWDALTQAINAVFASWHSPRAQAYRQRHDLRGVLGTAVNIQAMFPSQRAGVLFTADPNRPDAGEMVLEASWGLGEAVVSGAVTPDIYVLDARTLEILRTVSGDRPTGEPALDREQIVELGRLGQRIEAHFGVPSDIEWGLADGQIVLLQTRPIRGLDMLAEARRAAEEERLRLKQLAGRDHVVWVTHNLAETLPAPTPLTWDVVAEFMSGRGGFGRMYRELGYKPSPTVDRDGFLELICGRIYVDPRRAAGLFWGDLPLEYDADAIIRDRRTLEGPPDKLNMERSDPLFFLRLPGLAWSMIRCARRMKRMRRDIVDRFERALPRLEEYLRETRGADLSRLDAPQLIAEFHHRRAYVLGELAAESLLPGFFAGLAQARLSAWLTRLLGSEGPTWLAKLTSGLDGDITVAQNIELYRVARGENSLDSFLERFGHRASNEMELAEPRWREDRAFLERMIAGLRAREGPSPTQRHDEQATIRRESESALPHALAVHGGSSFRERVEAALHETQQLLPYREMGKFHLVRGYETLRQVLVELDDRLELGGDVFFLRLEELSAGAISAGADIAADRRELIERRKLRWKALQKLPLPDVIDSRELDTLGQATARRAVAGQRLPGRPISSGVAAGVARVVLDPREARNLGTAYILVCPSTDPGWTPLFLEAKGLVVERGGMLSHGAIVARDFGIPAVVYEDATRHIPDGTHIEIDGNLGEIILGDQRNQ